MSYLSTVAGSGDDTDHPGQCSLLGPFALFVQGALGVLALLSLVYKRWKERPQRPVKVWFFDVSKQVVGSLLLHVANLLLALLSSGKIHAPGDDQPPTDDPNGPNPCSWYFLNVLVDTTLGIALLYFALFLITELLLLLPPGFINPLTLDKGHYGNPPRVRWWISQSMVYFTALILMKFFIGIGFAIMPWLDKVGDWMLKWTQGNRKLQVVFVMFFFPLVMNVIQYWVVDGFIKSKNQDTDKNTTNDPGERGNDLEPDINDPFLFPPHPEPHEARRIRNYPPNTRSSISYTPLALDGAFGDDDDDDSQSRSSLKRPQSQKQVGIPKLEEYNPETDGTSPDFSDYDQAAPPIASESDSITRITSHKSEQSLDTRNLTGRGRYSRSSSMKLLPGSRGPGTPGYNDDGTDARSVDTSATRSGSGLGPTPSLKGSTLVGEREAIDR